MKFHYKKYGPGVLRPVIPIELSHSGKTLVYEVLVDSGADMCIFDAQVGEVLGIDIKKGHKGLVGGWPFEIQAGFLPQMAGLGYGVVGQKGFFDNFIIKFDLLKEEIVLKPRT